MKKFVLFFLVIAIIIGAAYGLMRYGDYRIYQEASKIDVTKWDEKYANKIPKNNYKIAVQTEGGGEWQFSYYLQKAAKNLGWEVRIYYKTFVGREKEMKDFNPDLLIVSSVEYEFDISPDFNDVKRYMFYTIPYEKIFYLDSVFLNKLRTKYKKRLMKYDGFLLTPPAIDIFKHVVETQNKKFDGISFYPTTYSLDKEYKTSDKMYYGSFNADKLRSSKKYKEMLGILASKKAIKFYGPKSAWGGFEKDWGGMLSKEQLLDTINSHGVSLVLHSDTHMARKIPTGRIFEAASANTVIICDRNKFVEENFGDSVLYIDITKSAAELAEQILDHFEWIKQNPQKAKELAARSNKIFKDRFALEKDLIRIAKMHESIVAEDKR